MVIRDLTLRSAASFGSFHLIRLLYDEYMFYLIEQRVAKAMNKTPVAIMATNKLADPQMKQGMAIKYNIFKMRSIYFYHSIMEQKYNILRFIQFYSHATVVNCPTVWTDLLKLSRHGQLQQAQLIRS